MIVANLSDRVRMRSPFILGGMVLGLIGYIINILKASNGEKFFGAILCILGLFGGMPSVYAWCIALSPVPCTATNLYLSGPRRILVANISAAQVWHCKSLSAMLPVQLQLSPTKKTRQISFLVMQSRSDFFALDSSPFPLLLYSISVQMLRRIASFLRLRARLSTA